MENLKNKEVNEANKQTTQNEVEQYKAKYGKVYRINIEVEPDDCTTINFEYFFTKPKVASFDRYVKEASKSSTRALKVFVLDNIIEEQTEKFMNDLEEYPALVLTVGEKLMSMLGMSKDVNLKML